MTLSEAANPDRWSNFWQNIAVGVVVAFLTGAFTYAGVIYDMGGQHRDTIDKFQTTDEHIADVRKEVGDVRLEQENVKKNLGEEHDHVRDVIAAVKALAEDLASGRAQTRARLTALEEQNRLEAEQMATNRQILLDLKDNITGMSASLGRHSDDLSAIRESLGVGKDRRH